MQLCKFFRNRLVSETSKYIFRDISKISSGINVIVRRDFHVSEHKAMAQTSITSFFKFTPVKGTGTSEKKEDTVKQETSPASNSNTTEKTETKSSKRQRLVSSGSESEAVSNSKETPHSSEKKKKTKRPRIESSESETETIKPSSPKAEVKSPSPEPTQTSPIQNTKIKLEKADSPKTYASPKTKKGAKVLKEVNKNKTPKTPPENKKAAVDNESLDKTKSPVKSPSPKSTKVKNEETSLAHSKDAVKDIENFNAVPVPESEYNPAKANYHPIKDACWAKGKPVPYLALAKTFEAIEPTSARLKIIEILSNYFRSVIVLTPEDLLPSVYMCLNQLAPAYHSLELGIAETYLMKAVGACTGRSLAQLRAALGRAGDLGALAEQARATQRTMFPQPPLTTRKVFAALKEIANMTGQASVHKKIAKIQSIYIACRDSEARYLIRSLEGKLRIGLAEQSVLQALALGSTLTPPGPAAPSVLNASKGMSAEKFKALVDENSLIIKTTYCECPNYEAVLGALLAHGPRALPRHCRLAVGVPLKPMLAHPTKGVHEIFNRFEGEQFTCEWKYDGERAQIHVPGHDAPDFARAAIYSRNQEDNTSKYPDVVGRLRALLKPSVHSCVLDCEAVAYDVHSKQILPFQVLSTRKRKDAAAEDIAVQVCVFVFDLLFLNGAPLVREPLAQRRQLLREHFTPVDGEWQFATSRDCGDMEEVQAFLEAAVRGSCEGLMVKALHGRNAHYDIARRSHNWLKLKKDYMDGVGDSIDVVVLGAYRGRGKRRAGYGGFLVACRDPHTDTYQTLCKLGTGFSDEQLASFTEALEKDEIPQPRSYYSYDARHVPDAWLCARAVWEVRCADLSLSPAHRAARGLVDPDSVYDARHEPDAWLCARAVWEVRCADLSLSPAHRAARGLVDPDKGISLRFPRFVRVRDDKTPEQATSAQQVAALYLAQDQVKNCAAKHNYTADDFY